jgi:hypothetical protein
MLRSIISVYKVTFLIVCTLTLLGCLLGGLALVIYGETPAVRLSGIGTMVFGTLFSVLFVGNLALLLENNELLRQIASNTSRGQVEQAEPKHQPPVRLEPSVKRREPTF